jgi:hypothetical protein
VDERDLPIPRYGHSSIYYKGRLIIYGGAIPMEYLRPKEDILFFDIGRLTIKLEKARFDHDKKVVNWREVPWRRNHIAAMIGGLMYIHGGISESEQFLNDNWVFELPNTRWIKLDIKGDSPILAHHCSCFVLESEKVKNYHVYKAPDIFNKNFIKKIKIEGLYVFGGVDENRQYNSVLRVLKTGRRPCEWIVPSIAGRGPEGRMNSTMNFYRDMNIIILHGGRNDSESKIISKEFWVIDLEKLAWKKVGTRGELPKERTEHGSCIYEDTLIIFGGVNAFKYNSMELCLLDISKDGLHKLRPMAPDIDIHPNKIREMKTVIDLKFKSKNTLPELDIGTQGFSKLGSKNNI